LRINDIIVMIMMNIGDVANRKLSIL